jgi:chloramphenicol-sensitive protein RarD
MTSAGRATVLVCFAYTWWGISPVFWRELGSVAAIDQLTFRVTLAFVCLSLVWLVRRRNPMRQLTRRHVAFGVFSALVIASNWAVFLWAVHNERAVEAALGYFIMPLFSVALGVGLLGERLRLLQAVALLLAICGIVWTLVVLRTVPWVGLAIGISFASYGWARKEGPWQAVDGLTFETMVLSPVLISVLIVRLSSGADVGGDGEPRTMVLLAITGLITMVPLLFFASAVKQASLVATGLLQYINPALQFLVGWKIFDESVSQGRLWGFAWIWAALALVVIDEVRSKRPVDEGKASLGQRFVRS